MMQTKTLLIDDDKEIQDAVSQTLDSLGHHVRAVCSAEEGLHEFSQVAFDLLITEIDLPGLDGIEAIQRFRMSDPTTVPMVITDRSDQETAVRAMEAGAQCLLLKPFTDLDLRLRVEKALRERRRIVDTRVLLGDLLQTRSHLQLGIAERERFLEHLIDAAPFGIISTDQEGRILTVNGKAEKMYGYPAEELVGRPASDLFGAVESAPGPLSSPDGQFELKASHRRRNGESLPVLMHFRDILDERGRRIARLHVVEDRSERTQMEQQLLHAERLSLLGQLAPRIAHEFKTPLQIISGNTELASACLEDGQTESLGQWLGRIQPAVDQMLDLIQEMTNIGKPADSKWEALHLRPEIEKVLDTLGPLGIIKYCEVECDLDGDLPAIKGDRHQIEQVFRNLIVNAAQAMERSNTKVLGLWARASHDGERIECTVRDTGPGIATDDLDRIFEPFFTTKPDGRGTGLGLPIVRTILDRHGAKIAVESTPGEGSCFTLAFPVLKEVTASAPVAVS
ncbi:MAG: ATP-binding protein [Candidatus Latescibacteria bacterium]|jgi:two-component system sensor histidine kinase AtoS|nr:ATP-binding protein [Candidatus Latescibacterota bacterium]